MQHLVKKYKDKIPRTRLILVSLAGLGLNTANFVLSVAFGLPAFAVDTHVERVSKRLQICKQSASVLEVEETLCKKLPKNKWGRAHHWMIFFGRYHCTARSPKCQGCPLLDLCAYGQKEV